MTRGRVADPATSAEAARLDAQKLAFAPLVFQACRVAREQGVLAFGYRRGARGFTAAEAAGACGLSLYAARLLTEACMVAGLLAHDEPRFAITKVGVYWEKDALTRVNADFVHHVCGRGGLHLGEALRTGLPAGLRELGDFSTIYEGLSRLAPDVRGAWLAFDHFYSDGVFEACLGDVLAPGVRHVVDVGGNTGRFARLVTSRAPDVRVTIVDLPGQLAQARVQLADLVDAGRVALHPADLLDPRSALPGGADAYWMSQFLDCFGEDEIASILARTRDAMGPGSRLFVLETFWDLQRHEAARFCVVATSLYFACMANGNSRMYHSRDLRALVESVGMSVEAVRSGLGVAHTLLRIGRASPAGLRAT